MVLKLQIYSELLHWQVIMNLKGVFLEVKKIKSLAVLGFVLLAVSVMNIACDNTQITKAGDATITEGVMTTSVDNNSKPTGGVTTSFPIDTPAIYCSFKLKGVDKEDIIKATWIYVTGEAKDKENMILLETYDIVQGDDNSYYLAFFMDRPASGWYKGEYKVVLSINNEEKLTVPFSVE